MKPYVLVAIALSALFAGCHERRQDSSSYDAVRAHSEESHKSLDSQPGQ